MRWKTVQAACIRSSPVSCRRVATFKDSILAQVLASCKKNMSHAKNRNGAGGEFVLQSQHAGMGDSAHLGAAGTRQERETGKQTQHSTPSSPKRWHTCADLAPLPLLYSILTCVLPSRSSEREFRRDPVYWTRYGRQHAGMTIIIVQSAS